MLRSATLVRHAAANSATYPATSLRSFGGIASLAKSGRLGAWGPGATKSPLGLRISSIHTSAMRSHGHVHKPKLGEELNVTFITKDGDQHHFEVAAGDNLMDIAQANGLDMEGACGGSCACSTCHIIVDPEFYDRMEEPSDDENDMLDLAFGLTETSRLGCQVVMQKDLDGIRVALPAMTRNLQARDFE